jgi:hypothetical protein
VCLQQGKAVGNWKCAAVKISYCYIYLSSVFRSVWTTTELLFVSVGCGDGLWVGDWGGSRIPPLVPSASHPPQRAEPYFPMSPATQHQNPSSGEVGCGVRKCDLREQPHGAR